MAACAGLTCRQGRALCRSTTRCGLVTTTPHGRLVDTAIHEAPQPARALQPEPPAMHLIVAYRLFKFYRESGMPFKTALPRAWAKRK